MRIASLLLLLLTASLSAAEPLPNGAIVRLGTRRFRHSGTVWSLAFAPDGKTLASGGWDSVIRFWDVKTGRQVRVPAHFGGWIQSLAFSPDGSTLVVRDWDSRNRIHLLNAATGRERRFAEIPNFALHCGSGGVSAFASDGETLAVTTPIGEVALYDAATLKQTAVLGKHDHFNVPDVAFSPDGRTLATAGQDATIRLWDVVKRKALFVLRSEDTTAFSIVFSRDGKWLISGGGIQDKPNDWSSPWKHPTIRIWDAATGKQLRVLKDTDMHGCIRSLALASDGRTLAASCENTLRLWDVKEGKLLRSLSGARSNSGAAALQFSPDGKLLAGGIGNTVALWDTASGRLLNLDPNESPSGIHSVAVSRDGRLLAAGDGVGGLVLWDLRARRFLRRFGGHKYAVKQVLFSPDDKTLASTSENRCVRVWDVDSGRLRYEAPATLSKDTSLKCLAYSPDGKFLATTYFSFKQGGGPRGILLLDADTGEQRQNLTLGDAIIGCFDCIGFSPDGRHLSGTTGGNTYSWRKGGDHFVEKRAICQVPYTRFVTYSPNGFVAVESFPPKFISYRDLETGQRKRELFGLLPLSNVLTFSRDGRYFASGPSHVSSSDPNEPRDDRLRVCEMASDRIVLRWHPSPHTEIQALTFTPDGRTLIAGISDSTILLYDVFPATRPAAGKLPAAWDALAGEAQHAHRALASLLAAGDDGVVFLTNRLHPLQPPEPKKLAHWLADLDSDEFAVREKATRELAKAAETIRPALVRARMGTPPLERRRRLDLLLEGIDKPVPSADGLRDIRAITALEYLNTAASRKLLQRLGEGAAEARRTREARAAYGRTIEEARTK